VHADDRLAVLHRGRILADGEAGEIGGDNLSARFLSMTKEAA